MVRLRVGRFAWELYYTHTRAVLPREELRRRLALVLGHGGYITGLIEYAMTDIFWLRSFAVAGCAMIAGFQFVQPKVQWLAVTWNLIYTGINGYQMYLLLDPAVNEDEALLQGALNGRLTLQQLHAVAMLGAWRSFEEGEIVEPTDSAGEIWFVARGECELQRGGLRLGRQGPGKVIGQLSPHRDADSRGLSVVAHGGLRCLCLQWDALSGALEADASLKDGMNGILAEALAARVMSMNEESKTWQYAAVLEAAGHVLDPSSAPVEDALTRYRLEYGISDELHHSSASMSRSGAPYFRPEVKTDAHSNEGKLLTHVS